MRNQQPCTYLSDPRQESEHKRMNITEWRKARLRRLEYDFSNGLFPTRIRASRIKQLKSLLEA